MPAQHSTKAQRELRRLAESLGYTLAQTSNGKHFQCRHPNGALVTVAAASEADGRTRRIVVARLRRNARAGGNAP
jgi:hypothetical protein